MAQADRVHSTPPTNTSAPSPQSSRRGFLVQATAVAAAGAALGTSLPSLPAPSAVTAQSCDAELIDLGARFEPLLDRYYVAHRRWSGALSQANAEHDREFGTPAQRNYEYSPEVAAGFEDNRKRVGVDEAGDALAAIHDEMEPLANAINAVPVNSVEGLRVKTLLCSGRLLRCSPGAVVILSRMASFQWLFTAVADLCGLKNKIRATDYQLPDDGFAYDDSDEGEDA